MSTACRICQLCLECCRSSLWTKGKGRSKPLWAVNWALFDHACVGKSVVQECCQRKGMCSGRLCIWKDSLCSQKVASICMAAIREGKSANPSRFPGVPGAGTPLQRQALLVLWQWDGYVLNICLLYWIAFGSMLKIFSWFQDEQYCEIVVQQAPRRCFI